MNNNATTLIMTLALESARASERILGRPVTDAEYLFLLRLTAQVYGGAR